MRISYLEGLERREIIDEKERLVRLFRTYSDEELLSRGERFVEEEDYLGVGIAFKELLSRNTKLREIAQLYISVTQPEILISAGKMAPHFDANKFIEESNLILDSMMGGMINAMEMHEDGILPDRDLSEIEKIVDKFPFGKIKTKTNFDRTYFEFKEYVNNVYLEKLD
jgi:hypothetical protein